MHAGQCRGASTRCTRNLSARRGQVHVREITPPPSPLRTNRTRRVPHPVLIGHAASLSQVYVREITNFVGTSGVDYDRALKARQNTNWLFPPGDFVDVIKPPVCPVVYQDGSGQCTSGTCRMCPIDFPDCPKEFLTNCTEVAVNLEKIKNTLNGTTRPLESYVKNAARYTAWTSCGLLSTSDRVSANRKVERRPSDADGGWASMPDSLSPGGADGTWWQPEDLELVSAPASEPPRASPPLRASAHRRTCPVSTEGWTRRVHFVREGGGGGGCGALLGHQ